MTTCRCGIFGWRRLAVLGMLLLVGGFGLYRWWNSPLASDLPEGASGDRAPSAESAGDERLRKLALGVWEDDFHGHRTMTLREDGTGTMVVELRGLEATLFASKLTFEMVWSVRDGRMQKRTVGGEPAGRVKLILKMMGDRVDEPILELTEDRLVLLDKDGKTKYNWLRKRDKG